MWVVACVLEIGSDVVMVFGAGVLVDWSDVVM